MALYRAMLVYQVDEDDLWCEPTALAKTLENDSKGAIHVFTKQSSVTRMDPAEKEPKDLRIDEMFAWVTLDDGDGNEGIIAYTLPGLGTVPAVGADLAMMEKLRPTAMLMAGIHIHPIELRRFSTMTVLETLPPGRGQGDG